MDRPLLRYFGGKFAIAPWIIDKFPQHNIYVEAFGGGGSILLRKPRSLGEVYNDLDGDIVNVFRTLQTGFSSLKNRLENTPFAREEFDLSWEDHVDPIERAARTIIRSHMSFGNSAHRAEGKTGFAAMNSITGNRASQWKNWLPCLEQFRERLMGVVIENKPAIEVIAQQDTPGTLFYLDPPYVASTRISGKYKYEMTDSDHRDICDVLSGIRGMAILSGYDNEIYSDLGWHRESTLAVSASGKADDYRTECLWINPAAMNGARQQSLFMESRC